MSSPSTFHTSFSYCDFANASELHIENYRAALHNCLPCLPPIVVDCCDPHCTEHCDLLDDYALWFVQCLLDCDLLWMPLRNSGGKCSVAGWNDGTQTLKADANFWYRVWSEAGCPCSGVLFEIKKKAKRIQVCCTLASEAEKIHH